METKLGKNFLVRSHTVIILLLLLSFFLFGLLTDGGFSLPHYVRWTKGRKSDTRCRSVMICDPPKNAFRLASPSLVHLYFAGACMSDD